MRRRSLFAALFPAALLLAAFSLATPVRLAAQTLLAPTPPMGWNSWDAYGLTVTEDQFKANVEVLAGIRQFGWRYAVIDEGWYMQDPFGGSREKQHYVYDAYGRQIPALNRFPESANGAGLKPLADWVHAKGLKFGIHLIRGIPRQDVTANTPIAGSNFHAADAADTTDACPWDDGDWGVKDNAAGQAWYDAMIALYAGWGVDFLKVDCIADHPYKPAEIRMIAAAIAKTGRPIVLSLSPGPTALEHASEVAQYAQMWRIADDHWDVWRHEPKPGADPNKPSEFPFGTSDEFDRLAAWNPYVKPGAWPDADMLPIGSLTPHPGWGDPRESRLTHDEQRAEITLWAIARAPLILGNNLTKLDDFTRALITNREVLAMNQTAVTSFPVPSHIEGLRIWAAQTSGPRGKRYLAVFNRKDAATTFRFDWAQAYGALPQGRAAGRAHLYDVWAAKTLPAHKGLSIAIAAHGCALLRLE